MTENIIKGEALRRKIKKSVDKLSSAVKVTLGPKGKNVIINKEQKYVTTKDGVSVANSVYSTDPSEQIIIDMIKDISKETNKNAGDGTTTSIVLAEKAILSSFNKIKNGSSSVDIVKELQIYLSKIIKYIDKNSVKIKSNKELKNIALISSNNDKNISKLVFKAMDGTPSNSVVSISGEIGVESRCIKKSGYTFDVGADERFLNASDGYSLKIDNPSVLLIDGKLNSIKPISFLLENIIKENDLDNRNIIIIAEMFSSDILNVFLRNKEINSLNIIPIKTPGVRFSKKNFIDDVAGFIGTTVFKIGEYNYKLKTVDSISIDKYSTTITLNKNNSKERIKQLELLAKSSPNKFEKDKIKNRIDLLSNKSSEIIIGGNSELEINEAIDRVEDSINAVKAALNEGIVSGGGVILKDFVIEEKPPKYIEEILLSPMIEINKNAGNNLKDRIKLLKKGIGPDVSTEYFNDVDMVDNGIIDPSIVTKEAVKNAFSIAAMLISTEVLIIDKINWN